MNYVLYVKALENTENNIIVIVLALLILSTLVIGCGGKGWVVVPNQPNTYLGGGTLC